MWGCIVNNSYPRHCTWFIWEAQQQKKKKAHHIHRWLPNPRQMSKGLTWQPEHLWKRSQHREHDGFTDGYMCREMMESPSQMLLYHLIFRDIKSKQCVWVCVSVCLCVKVTCTAIWSVCLYLLELSKEGSKTTICVFMIKSHFKMWQETHRKTNNKILSNENCLHCTKLKLTNHKKTLFHGDLNSNTHVSCRLLFR